MKPKVFPAMDKPDRDGKTYQLFIYCSWKSMQAKFYSGQRAALPSGALPKAGEWDAKNQRIAGSSLAIKSANGQIADRVNLLEKIHRNAELLGTDITKEFLRSEYEKVYPSKRTKPAVQSTEKLTFFSAFPEFVRVKTGLLSPGHLRKFNQVLKHLQAFNPDLTWDQISHDFYQNYLHYLVNEAELSNNTIKHHADCIRSVMKYGQSKKILVATDYTDFTAQTADTSRIYHTEEELALIGAYQTTAPGEERAVDVYRFGCYTGLRFNDVRQLRPENIHSEVLHIVQHKGKNVNAIQLNRLALAILDKYYTKDAEFCLPVISNWQTNEHLKRACKKMGINQPTQRVIYRGNERMEETVPKYELVSFHTSRHTFATISLRRGMKLEVLQEILGHRDINTTRNYAKILSEEKHQAMKDIWNR